MLSHTSWVIPGGGGDFPSLPRQTSFLSFEFTGGDDGVVSKRRRRRSLYKRFYRRFYRRFSKRFGWSLDLSNEIYRRKQKKWPLSRPNM